MGLKAEVRNLPGRAAQRHSCKIAVRRQHHECRSENRLYRLKEKDEARKAVVRQQMCLRTEAAEHR